jgi:hypothetical protein
VGQSLESCNSTSTFKLGEIPGTELVSAVWDVFFPGILIALGILVKYEPNYYFHKQSQSKIATIPVFEDENSAGTPRS